MNKSSLIKNNKSIIGHVKAYSKKNGSPSIQRAATFGISGRGDLFALNKLSSSAWMVEGGLMESHQRRGYHLPGDNKASQTIHSKDLFVDEEKEVAEGEEGEMSTSKMIEEAWNHYHGIKCAKDREMSMDAFKRIMGEGDQWENQLAEIVVYLNGECEQKMDEDKMEQVLIQSVMREKKTVLDSIAIHFLAEMKEDRGQYTEAVKYYELSSLLGNAASLNSLADLYMQGNKQIKKNQKKAISYLKEASDLGCTVSTMHLYKLHFYGLYGQEKDLSQAISYLEKASDLGDENSLFILAQITKRPSLLSSILPSGYAKNLSPTSKLNQIIFV